MKKSGDFAEVLYFVGVPDGTTLKRLISLEPVFIAGLWDPQIMAFYKAQPGATHYRPRRG